MKKFLSLLLSALLALGIAVPAYATEQINSDTDETTQPTIIGDIFYYNADTGETIAENGDLYAFDDVEFQVPASSSQGGITIQGDLFELYLIRGGLKKTSGGVFTWWFNVDCPTSPFNKPYIKIKAQLQGNFSTGSSFSNVSSKTHTFATNSDYGADYTWTSTAKTGYYRFVYTLTDYDAGGQVQTRTTTSNLWNRTGHVWNFTFSDSASGKSLPKPPANYPKGATSTRPSNLANTYYNTYTSNTGITLNRSLYDVHHIRPLAYGGGNSYSNLIHLPKATHTKVTSWWAGY